MFTAKTVREYVAKIISDLDSGNAPRRPRVPTWVRSLAVPSAVGLSMALSGCAVDSGEQGEVTREMASAAKADGYTDFLCRMLGQRRGCDVCEVLGWYGDGVCDDFCDRPDPDCTMVPLYGVPLPDGDCWTNADCDAGEHCEGASTCPEGAYCIVAPEAGTCVPDAAECWSDAECAESEECIGASTCPEGAYCIIAPEAGTCQPTAQGCSNGVDNDGDGAIDCADSDCSEDDACGYQALYSAPFGG